MRTNTLMRLTALTAVVVAAAALTVWQQRRAQAPVEPLPLIDGLADRVNDVNSIQVTQGERSIELARVNHGWVIADRDSYPARVEQIRRVVLDLAELKRLEQKTADEDLLGPLGFGPKAVSEPILLTIGIAGQNRVALEVGATSPDGLGRYVRMLDDGGVWIVDGLIQVDPTLPAWADTDLLRLGSDFLRSIVIERPGEPRITVTKQGSGPDAVYSIDPMPTGREIGSPSQFARLFGSVALLTFTDVAAASDTLEAPEQTFRYTTTTGSAFAIDVWTRRDEVGENATWIKISYENAQSDRKRLEGWLYRLTPYAAEAFKMGVDDLTYELPEEVDPAGESQTVGPSAPQ